jgi:predicted lipoprotein with Yx(FWY)xxD motif
MKALIALLIGLAVAATVTSLAMGSAEAKPTLMVAKSRYGRILFDGKGRVLYAFTRDRRGGTSRCYGDCAAAWPVYYRSGALRAGKGVQRSLLGTTRRKGGRLQVTYNGWPLYYYQGDRSPGAISCQNVDSYGGIWLVVSARGRPVR